MIKILNALIFILDVITCTTIFVVIFAVGDFLMESNMISMKYSWNSYFYWIGFAGIYFYVCRFIYYLKQKK